jgi:hypothetical protein
MNILEELEDIFSLAEDDEKFFLKECIINIRKVHERRPDPDDLPDLVDVQDRYKELVDTGVPHREWPKDVLNYEAFAVVSNVNASGGCFPGNNVGPTVLGDKEEWGIADVYPVLEPEVEDV